METMKERFARLLLGEDMSGSGRGVGPALTISNAITNLCGTVGLLRFSFDSSIKFVSKCLRHLCVLCYISSSGLLLLLHVAIVFGQLWRLELLPYEKKSMWQREIE